VVTRGNSPGEEKGLIVEADYRARAVEGGKGGRSMGKTEGKGKTGLNRPLGVRAKRAQHGVGPESN